MSQLTNNSLRAFGAGYGLAIVCTLLATCSRLLLLPQLGTHVPFITYFPGVFMTALYAGLGPTLFSVALSALAASHFFMLPADSLLPVRPDDWTALAIFCCFGVGVAVLGEHKHRQLLRVREERERFCVTLASIGDGVIVTDQRGRIAFMNHVAEQLTGRSQSEASGEPVEKWFRIIDQRTGQSCENPVLQPLRGISPARPANSTAALIAKDGSERVIEENAATIRAADGTVVGAVLVFRDVSQQRNSQMASARLAALVDSSDDAIFAQTFEGVVTDWNAGAERLFGYKSEEIVGRSVFDTIVPSEHKDELLHVLQRVQRGSRDGQFESVRQRRDGRRIPVAVRISPIYDAEGTPVGASAIDRDISQHKAAERRRNARLAVTQILAREENVDKAIAEILTAVSAALQWDLGCFWRMDPAKRVLQCQEFCQSTARDLESFRSATMQLEIRCGGSLPGRSWREGRPVWIADVVNDTEFIRAPQAMQVGLHGGFACPVTVDDELLGVVEWFSQEIQQPDADLLEMMATICGQIGQFMERKNSQRAVRERDRLYRAIGESIDYGVWVSDPDGRVTYISDSFLRLVGMTAQQCGDFGWTNLLHPEDVDDTIAAWQQCVRIGGTWDREHRFLGADGKYHPVLARGVPVKDDNGNVVCWVGINLDISRIKEVEDALRDADRRKDEFLAMLAHELRNPLAPIRSGLDILAMDAGPHQETIELMQEQVEHVVRLVDDLLDVSRIMRGKIELRKEPTQLATLIHRSVEAVRPMIDSHGQQLAISLPEQPVWLSVDPVRVVQVIENLLNNASKYTDAGGRIELTASCQNGQAVIRVQDTGVGIEPELLPKVFELFTQSSRSLDRAQGGLGIGLTLVRRLVQLHAGTVSVHSAGAGQGSTFIVRLPKIDATMRSEELLERPLPIHTRRILVVDDNAGAARMLALLLSKLDNHEIATAHDGATALAMIDEFDPEIAFIDIGLPGMDGYQIGEAIRKNPAHDHVLLVALTGYGQPEDRRRSHEAGFDEHLVKPPSLEQIEAILVHPKLRVPT